MTFIYVDIFIEKKEVLMYINFAEGTKFSYLSLESGSWWKARG